jgi:hypothetical protein
VVRARLARIAGAALLPAALLGVSASAHACPYCASGGVSKGVAALIAAVMILPFVVSAMVLRVVLRTSSDLDGPEAVETKD